MQILSFDSCYKQLERHSLRKSGIERSSSRALCESALTHPGYRLLIRHDFPLSLHVDRATGCLTENPPAPSFLVKWLGNCVYEPASDECGLRRGINGGFCFISNAVKDSKRKGDIE
ncbi:hypothetical protein CEXT_91921 [Caerostris extrusa]|uniref:Uncharacterized protein n=1 Tax=Caerostris extrusa TaxID=172846 RepID=A0AAV4XE17_CAEEX|nr:hypothetical protein CEXT_91921 [Caerostris extrusa]